MLVDRHRTLRSLAQLPSGPSGTRSSVVLVAWMNPQSSPTRHARVVHSGYACLQGYSHSQARTQNATQARKHASTQARKHASTQARKHASTHASQRQKRAMYVRTHTKPTHARTHHRDSGSGRERDGEHGKVVKEEKGEGSRGGAMQGARQLMGYWRGGRRERPLLGRRSGCPAGEGTCRAVEKSTQRSR